MRNELREFLKEEYRVEVYPCRVRNDFYEVNNTLIPDAFEDSEFYNRVELPDLPEMIEAIRGKDLEGLLDDALAVSEVFSSAAISELMGLTKTTAELEDFEDMTIDELYDELVEHTGAERAFDEFITEENEMENHEILSQDAWIELKDEYIDKIMMYNFIRKPDYFNEKTAIKCNLYPFKYDGENYLAFGGAGMDMSPKLDAYQLLVTGSMPTDSAYFRGESEKKYFEDFFEKSVLEEIEEKIAKTPETVIMTKKEV